MSEPKTALELAAEEAAAEKKRGIVPVKSGTSAASIHDQGLSGLIGAGIVWGLVTYGGATPPEGAAVPLVYGYAGALGATIGSKIPGKYRGTIQTVAGLLGLLYARNLFVQ